MQWQPCADNNAHLEVRYRAIEDQLAIEMAIKVETLQSYQAYEMFVSSYFTPNHTPRFALQSTNVDPATSLRWYETTWCGSYNDQAWPRDDDARQLFLETTVRMEIVEASDDKLNELAVARYQAWDA